ncbi:MAG: D-alanine--D-alanine ligase family protein [Myxococcota bacterium]
MAKLRVGLLFGGRSTEHEVSIASANSILGALDPARYDVRLIAVSPDGRWHLGHPSLPPDASVRGEDVSLPAVPGVGGLVRGESRGPGSSLAAEIDVVFPIIHGRGGEDGALQGLLEMAELPYVGSGVLGSAVQMDKDVAKRLLAAAGLPVVPWITIRGDALSDRALAGSTGRAVEAVGLPCFVKPANSGSSVGTHRVRDVGDLEDAVRDAARFDTKVLVEKAIEAREIEVAVIGNRAPEASLPGEIRMGHEFYDYEAKYADDEGTELVIPADIDESEVERIRAMAVEAYRVLDAEGLARVDFLLDRDSGELYINELNSLPGFTESSMFPRLWEATGLPYPALIDRLIELALERHAERSRLETTYRRG